MPTPEDYSGLPIEARLSRLEQIPGELERAISGKTDTELSQRPDAHNWAAKEIVCHLRDVEELFQIRFHTVVALDEPRILVFGASAMDLAASYWLRFRKTVASCISSWKKYSGDDTQKSSPVLSREHRTWKVAML